MKTLSFLSERLLREKLHPRRPKQTKAKTDFSPDSSPVYRSLNRSLGRALHDYQMLADGDRIEVGGAVLEAIHTPGHTPFHYCFRSDATLFSGDHVLGGTTVIVEHMADYLDSLEKVRGTGLKRLFPGHGPIMRDPDSVFSEYIDHRIERESQIRDAVAAGAGTIGRIVERVYAEIDPVMWPLAARSVGAHLRKLADEGELRIPYGSDDWTSPVEQIPVAEDRTKE